jgi:hypothetical protein
MAQPSGTATLIKPSGHWNGPAPIKKIQVARLDVEQWRLLGSLITGEVVGPL